MVGTVDTAQESALKPKTKLTGKILKTTIGGAILDIGQDLPGVLHISQLQREPINKVEDVIQVGQTVDVWVRRVKSDRVELTMIEPLALEWRELKPDMVVKGKVVRLETYGAFIEIGAERPGMVHISEMARGYVKNPNEIVKEGDEIEAMVLEVNRRKKQIRLSMKVLQPKAIEVAEPKEKPKKRRAKRSSQKEVEETKPTPTEPEPTTMEIAWRQAMERAEERRQEQKTKQTKPVASEEQENILNRTLEQRLPSG
jgi:ribosomal protein S1